MARRLQRSRRKGARLPAGAVCVTRPGRYANPFALDHPAVARLCALQGLDPKDEAKRRQAAVDLHSLWLFGCLGILPPQVMALTPAPPDPPGIGALMAELAGKDLACWCPLDGQPCHADTLLSLANP